MNYFAIGFVAVLGVVGAGVDYQQQSARAGVPLGQMSASGYFATINARIEGAKAEKVAEAREALRKQAWKQGGVQFLPEAPEGWQRRRFDEGDNSAVAAPSKLKLKGSSPLVLQFKQREAADAAKRIADQSWVYQRGDEMVFVQVSLVEEIGNNSLVGMVANTINGLDTAMSRPVGYMVAGGVGFTETLDWEGKREHHFRNLSGVIGFGDEVRLRVHANASQAATREILNAIDFDGLNGLLPQPMATVGNAVRVPANMDEAELAGQMADLRSEFLALRAAEAQYRVGKIDATALMINTVAQGYGARDGVTDLTAGKAVDMSTLINMGYRAGMADLMDGRVASNGAVELAGIMNGAVESARAAEAAGKAPAPVQAEMSEALARELGLSRPSAPVAAQAGGDSPGKGLIASIAGMFGGARAGDSAAASAPRVTDIEVNRLSAGGGGPKTGGCGAGKFCKVDN